MATDPWRKAEFIISVFGFILIPIVIFFTGVRITQMENERVRLGNIILGLTSLIEPLSSTEPKQQLIALAIVNSLVELDAFPRDFAQNIIDIAKTTDS